MTDVGVSADMVARIAAALLSSRSAARSIVGSGIVDQKRQHILRTRRFRVGPGWPNSGTTRCR
jgi:hypothetical protein